MELNISDQQFRNLEGYILSDNKQQFIDSLIKGSQDFTFFNTLHKVNSQKISTLEDYNSIKDSKTLDSNTKNVLKVHLLLRRFENAKDNQSEKNTILNELRSQLGVSYSYSKPNTVTSKAFSKVEDPYPSTYPQQTLDLQQYIDSAYTNKDSFRSYHTTSYSLFDGKKLAKVTDQYLLEHFLQGAQPQDFENYVDILDQYINLIKPEQQQNVHLPSFILPKLTLDHYKEIHRRYPHFSQDLVFIKQLLIREFRLDGSLRNDSNMPVAAKIKIIQKIHEWAQTICIGRARSLIKETREALVTLNVELGEFNAELFQSYLKDPSRSYEYIESNYYKEIQQSIINSMDWQDILPYSSCPSSTVIEAYLKHFFKTASNISPYGKYFNQDYLLRLFYTTKIYQGEEIAEINKHFSESQIQKLHESRQLAFSDSNQKYFLPSDPVNLELTVKNISSLDLKVFEFCSENYYLKEKKQIDGTMNLDGLITTEESTETIQAPSAQIVSKKVSFDSISSAKRGIFVVDVIGGGLSARAVIKKGKLNYIERKNVAGHVITILNEDKQICKGGRTGLWFQKKFYEADKNGEILIYCGSGAGTHDAVLVHDNFAELTSLTIQGEDYEFRCAYLYQEESFLMGNKARILLQPRLFMNNMPASFGIVKEFTATVTTTTDEGVPTNTVFENLKPDASQEIPLEFTIPPRLQKINVQVQVSVNQMYHKEPRSFTSNHNIFLNLHQHSNDICQMYLRYTTEGYEICILGKNGEPQSNIRLKVSLQNKFVSWQFSNTLQTDVNGCVYLGKLENFTRIQASSSAGGDVNSCNRTWNINSDQKVNYPSSLTLVEGTDFVFPLLHNQLTKHKLSFVEMINSNSLRDAISQLSVKDNTLRLNGLKQGKYQLYFKDVDQKVNVQVLKGEYWQHDEDYIVTENSIRNIKNQADNIVIQDVKIQPNEKDATKGTITISAFADAPKVARFHIFASSFLESDSNENVNKLNKNKVQPSFSQASFSKRLSLYLNNRKLGEEFTYILDRKNKSRFMGNTLDRPQLLLKRTFVRDTNTVEEVLETGDEFSLEENQKKFLKQEECEWQDQEQQQVDMPCEKGKSFFNRKSSKVIINNGLESFTNFLAHPSLILENIKLNQAGQIILDNFPLDQYSFIQIIGTNLVSNISTTIPLPKTKIQTRDLTLKTQMKKGEFYSINYTNSCLQSNEKLKIKDMTSTELKIIDSVQKLFDTQKALILTNKGHDTENGGYDFWKFLTEWNSFSYNEKLLKYDKYASHELNVFLYLKDNEFFKKVVKGFISNKIEKQPLDYFLIEDREQVLKYSKAKYVEKLNLLEVAFLIIALNKYDRTQAESIMQVYQSKGKLLREDNSKTKRLFETVLKSKTQGEDTLRNGLISSNKENKLIPSSSCIARAPTRDDCLRTSTTSSLGVVKEQSKSISKFCADEDCEEDRICDGLILNKSEIEVLDQRKQVITGFQEMGKTKEFKERQYYNTDSVSISLSKFWVELFTHLTTYGQAKPFLPASFIHAQSNHTEMIAALSFISFPAQTASHDFKASEGLGLEITTASNIIAFQKEISQGESKPRPDILVAQRFFDPKDRTTISEEDGVQIEKDVEQFVVNKVYGCKVTVTNCSIANQEFQVLIEVPQGSIPVYTLDYTKSHDFYLGSTATNSLECFFYFPEVGNYPVHPVSVSKNGKIVAQAKDISIQVDKERVFKNLESFTAVLSQGSESDILSFVKAKNIWDRSVFSFHDVWWLLKSKEFFTQFIAILRERKIYDQTTWSFGFLHDDEQVIQEYLADYEPHLFQGIQYADYSLLQVNRRKLREYHPYVNPRVHLLANEKNQILNVQLKNQYRSYVRYLCEVDQLKTEHYITFVYYLLLQDRVEEAIKIFNKINAEEVRNDHQQEIQYDYFSAYINFYTGYPDFKVAREVSAKYIDYPILSWRSLFVEVANQLAEFDGTSKVQQGEGEDTRDEDKSKENLLNAQKEEILSMELDKTKLIINYQNIKSISVFFYQVDIEILFSRNPFLSATNNELTFIKANHTHEVKIEDSKELQKVYYEIPPNLQTQNLFIQLRSGDRIISLNYFSTSLDVQVIESFGQVKVIDAEGKPLSKCYVKCFAKSRNNGKSSFYKDGYTDLRGRFDYATLSGGDVSNVDKFSLLILSDEQGGLIKECSPPKKIGEN